MNDYEPSPADNMRRKIISHFLDYIENLPYDILVDETHTIYLDGEEIKTYRRNIEAFAPWLRSNNERRDSNPTE